MAGDVLTQFQAHGNAWTRVHQILEESQVSETKFFAVGILDTCIATQWKILPPEQADGIKSFLVELVIKLSSDEASLAQEKVLLGKLNQALVQVVKQEWPKRWPSFIPDIVGASKSSESLCQNNMEIFKLLRSVPRGQPSLTICYCPGPQLTTATRSVAPWFSLTGMLT